MDKLLAEMSARLDKLPQVPSDYANHVVYGGLGVPLALITSPITATLAVLALAAAKKYADYKRGETVAMCVGKTLVSAIWPASTLLF